MSKPAIVPGGDAGVTRNFQEVVKKFSEMHKMVDAKELVFTVVTGDNFILPTVPKPRGRLITYQDASATFFDKGLDSFGRWILNASAPCTIRISFF